MSAFCAYVSAAAYSISFRRRGTLSSVQMWYPQLGWNSSHPSTHARCWRGGGDPPSQIQWKTFGIPVCVTLGLAVAWRRRRDGHLAEVREHDACLLDGRAYPAVA